MHVLTLHSLCQDPASPGKAKPTKAASPIMSSSSMNLKEKYEVLIFQQNKFLVLNTI